MALYKYKVITERGDIIAGVKEAESEEELIKMLKKSNYYPISIKAKIGVSFIKERVSKKDLSILCRQLSTMLKAGISIVYVLDILVRQIENTTLKKAVSMIYHDVHKGETISTAMEKHKKVFPTLLVNMIKVGEVTGNLDLIIERMAYYYENANKIENKIKSALVYPILLSITSILVVIFLLTMVMPSYVAMFESNGLALPTSTRLMLAVSKGLTKYWYIIVILLAFLILSIRYYSKKEEGALYLDSLKLKLPIFKRLNTKIINSSFARTMSMLLSSGIPLLQALDIAKKAVGNKIVSNKLEMVEENIKKGISFSEAIKDTYIFEPMIYSMIKIGEETGALDKLLHKAADYFEEEVNHILHRITTLVEPILIVFMALIIGFIVVSMTMPMLDMINSIQI